MNIVVGGMGRIAEHPSRHLEIGTIGDDDRSTQRIERCRVTVPKALMTICLTSAISNTRFSQRMGRILITIIIKFMNYSSIMSALQD